MLNKCLRKEGAHSRLQPGRYQASYQAARPSCVPVWTKTCNILGPHKMHTAESAPIRLIRAMFSALLAARQLFAVLGPGSGEVTAFRRQGQGRIRPCGASRIQGSAQLEGSNPQCILGQTLPPHPGWYPLTHLDCKRPS